MKYIVVFCMCVFPFLGSSQSISDELRKINTYYVSDELFSLTYEYALYLGEESLEANEIKTVTTYIKGRSQQIETDGMFVITSEAFNFYVDGKEQTMILTIGTQRLGESTTIADQLKQIDDMLIYCTDTVYTQKGKVKKISLKTERSRFNQIDIEYDHKDYHVQKIVMYMKKNELMQEGIRPRVELRYTSVKKGGQLPSQLFQYDKFLMLDDQGALSPRSIYRGYKFSNYLPK